MPGKPRKKPPSRKRYEEEHPTISFRSDKQTYKLLKEHLGATGCSIADFVKDALGREKSMVEKRIEKLASHRINLLEDRLRCLESLVNEIFVLRVDTDRYAPMCPRCENQDMSRCEGREMESKLAFPFVFTWKCPKCGFFMDTYQHIDPKSLKWVGPDGNGYLDKPKTSARH